MAEEKKATKKETTEKPKVKKVEQKTDSNKAQKKNTSKVRSSRVRDSKRKGKGKRGKKKDELMSKIVKIRRVTRMYKGGRRMRLSIVVVAGDGKGNVGVGTGKGADVRGAQEKAVANAKKNMKNVSLKGNTIPHEIRHKKGAAKVLLKPAAPGTGIVAGSSMRMVAEVAGIKDMLGKIIGTNNPITNAYASVEALSKLRKTRL